MGRRERCAGWGGFIQERPTEGKANRHCASEVPRTDLNGGLCLEGILHIAKKKGRIGVKNNFTRARK